MDYTEPPGYKYQSYRSLNIDAKRAFGTGKAHSGVKTVSALSVLPNFDMV